MTRKSTRRQGKKRKAKRARRRSRVGDLKLPMKGLPSVSGQDWMEGAAGWYRPIKRPVTLRLDADVVAWFKAKGPGYQTRINNALRKLMMDSRKSRSRR